MSRLIFENLSTEEAIALAHWYEGQGEQSYYDWNECSEKRTRVLVTDVRRAGGFMEIHGDDVVIFIRGES